MDKRLQLSIYQRDNLIQCLEDNRGLELFEQEEREEITEGESDALFENYIDYLRLLDDELLMDEANIYGVPYTNIYQDEQIDRKFNKRNKNGSS